MGGAEVVLLTGIVAAGSGAVGVVLGIVGLRRNSTETSRNVGVEVLLTKEAEFDGPRIRRHRSALAGHVLQVRGRATEATDVAELLEQESSVPDFFEVIGLFLRRGVLDTEFAWSSFEYWTRRWWLILEPGIREFQRTEPEVWSDFEWLTVQLTRFENERRTDRTNGQRQAEPLTDAALTRFLNMEKAIAEQA